MKKIIISVLILLLLCSFATAYTPIAKPCDTVGLKAMWKMNETGSDANAIDCSANSKDLTGTNIGAGDWVAGQYNNSVDLDGSSESLNDANAEYYHSEIVTVDLSVYPHDDWDALASQQTLVGTADFDGTKGGWYLFISDGTDKLTFDMRDAGGTSYAMECNKTSWDANTWYHIYVSQNTTTGGAGFCFINGVDETPGGAADRNLGNHSDYPLGVGWRSSTSSRYFDGLIDDLAIYDISLDPSCSNTTDILTSTGWCYEGGVADNPPTVTQNSPVNASSFAYDVGTVTLNATYFDDDLDNGTMFFYSDLVNGTTLVNSSGLLENGTAYTFAVNATQNTTVFWQACVNNSNNPALVCSAVWQFDINASPTFSLDMLFIGEDSGLGTSFNVLEHIMPFVNLTEAGSPINDSTCTISTTEAGVLKHVGAGNQTICSVGCDFTSPHNITINVSDIDMNPVSMFFNVLLCFPELTTEDLTVNITCDSGSVGITFPQSGISVCDNGISEFILNTTVCKDDNITIVTFDNGNPTNNKRHTIVDAILFYDVINASGTMVYNGTTELYQTKNEVLWDTAGNKNISVICNETNSSEVIEIGNVLPTIIFIDITRDDESFGWEVAENIGTVSDSSNITFFTLIFDVDLVNHTETIVDPFGSVIWSEVQNTSGSHGHNFNGSIFTDTGVYNFTVVACDSTNCSFSSRTFRLTRASAGGLTAEESAWLEGIYDEVKMIGLILLIVVLLILGFAIPSLGGMICGLFGSLGLMFYAIREATNLGNALSMIIGTLSFVLLIFYVFVKKWKN